MNQTVSLEQNLNNLELYISKVEEQILKNNIPEAHHFLNGLYAAVSILKPKSCNSCGGCPSPCDNSSIAE